nr:CU044_2847 family protein [Streptomonospora nanhaiensis]
MVPVTIDGQDVYIEVRRLPGSEPTSSARLEAAGRKAVEALDLAQDAVVSVAARFASTVADLGRQAVRPESVSVEFGITIATEGNVILLSGSAQASLSVVLTYPCRPPRAD